MASTVAKAEWREWTRPEQVARDRKLARKLWTKWRTRLGLVRGAREIFEEKLIEELNGMYENQPVEGSRATV
jgi:hypothetical protein